MEVEDTHIRAKLGEVCLTLQITAGVDDGRAGYVSAKACPEAPRRRAQLTVESVDHAIEIAELAQAKLKAFEKNRTGSSRIAASGESGRVLVGSTAYLPLQLEDYMFKLTWEPAGRRARSPPSPARQPNVDILREAADLTADTLRALRQIRQNHAAAPSYPLPNRLYYDDVQPAWRWIGRPANGSAAQFRTEPPPGTPITVPVAFRLRERANIRHPHPNLNLNAPLGEGAHGQVFKATLTQRHQVFAQALSRRVPRNPRLPLGEVAAIKLQALETNKEVYKAIAESKIHASLMPTGVVPRLYASGYQPDTQTFVTIMQLVNGAELESWLKAHGGVLPAKLFVNIEDAVVKLWQTGVAHADLNSKNIIVLPSKEVRIIDFGESVALPGRLIPRSRQQALDRTYQAHLLEYLEHKYQHIGWNRGAPDPHVLRWLYSLVTNKAGIARLRRD